MNIKTLGQALIFLGGAAIGVSVSAIFFKAKYQKEFEEKEEILNMMLEKAKKKVEDSKEKEAEDKTDSANENWPKRPRISLDNVIEDIDDDQMEDFEGMQAISEAYANRGDDVYEISIDEFGDREVYDEFECLYTLDYIEANGLVELITVDGDAIDDPAVVEVVRKALDKGSKVVCVRSEPLASDFKVTIVDDAEED